MYTINETTFDTIYSLRLPCIDYCMIRVEAVAKMAVGLMVKVVDLMVEVGKEVVMAG